MSTDLCYKTIIFREIQKNSKFKFCSFFWIWMLDDKINAYEKKKDSGNSFQHEGR
jgi:hypothetical protein